MATIIKSQATPNKRLNCISPATTTGYVVENIDLSVAATTAAAGIDMYAGKNINFIQTGVSLVGGMPANQQWNLFPMVSATETTVYSVFSASGTSPYPYVIAKYDIATGTTTLTGGINPSTTIPAATTAVMRMNGNYIYAFDATNKKIVQYNIETSVVVTYTLAANLTLVAAQLYTWTFFNGSMYVLVSNSTTTYRQWIKLPESNINSTPTVYIDNIANSSSNGYLYTMATTNTVGYWSTGPIMRDFFTFQVLPEGMNTLNYIYNYPLQMLLDSNNNLIILEKSHLKGPCGSSVYMANNKTFDVPLLINTTGIVYYAAINSKSIIIYNKVSGPTGILMCSLDNNLVYYGTFYSATVARMSIPTQFIVEPNSSLYYYQSTLLSYPLVSLSTLQ